LSHGRPLFLLLYLGLIVFSRSSIPRSCSNPTETADNLKKHGGFIPGIRPGERTAEYIDYVLSRINGIGRGLPRDCLPDTRDSDFLCLGAVFILAEPRC